MVCLTFTPAAAASDSLARSYRQHVDWHACALSADDELVQELDGAGITVPIDSGGAGDRSSPHPT